MRIKGLCMFHKNFIDFAIVLLFKDRKDHLYSFCLFGFIVFILSAVLFISDSLQYDIEQSLHHQPDIVVKSTKASRSFTLNDEHMYDISLIPGVSNVEGVVQGAYYFAQKRLFFHMMEDKRLGEKEMVVGEGVRAVMKEMHYDDVFNFLTEERIISVKIAQNSPHLSNAITNDVIFLHPKTLRKILDLDANEFTTLYVHIPNKNEVGEIALKIETLFPSFKALSKEDAMAESKHLFYYKGGIFMILYVVSLVSFFILLKNQISLVYGEKKKEITILRSIGFCIKDIIALKTIQNTVIAISAFLLGVALAYGYVFVMSAPFLREIFVGSLLPNTLSLTPVLDMNILFLLFIFTVIPFLAFVIIPSWKIAISDMSEAVRA